MENNLERIEVTRLLLGETFSGEYHGLSYVVKCKWGEDWNTWGEDWNTDLELISLKPHGDNAGFWIKEVLKLDQSRVFDILYETLMKLPKVVNFQSRIDACREIDEDILDEIIESIEKNKEINNDQPC